MNEDDLTRWNRASLDRFVYVDGTAPVWLEELRAKHLSLFLADGLDEELYEPRLWRERLFARPGERPAAEDLAAAKAALRWLGLWRDPPARAENLHEWLARLLEDYGSRRADQTSEIARAFARALHILTEYVNAYANEGYLRTATQWDNVQRLARMVGYEPAPPASASTHIALLARPAAGSAKVGPGLAFEFAPKDGGQPLIFETLSELETGAGLNGMRAAGWSCNPEQRAASALSFAIQEQKLRDQVTPGQPTLLVEERPNGTTQSRAFRLAGIGDDGTVALPAGITGNWTVGDARLLVAPKALLKSAPTGTGAALVSVAGALAEGDVIAWQTSSGWVFARVLEVSELGVRLDPSPPAAGVTARVAVRQPRAAGSPKSEWPVPKADAISALGKTVNGGITTIAKTEIRTKESAGKALFDFVNASDSKDDLFVVLTDSRPVKLSPQPAAATAGQPALRFAGAPPKGLAGDAWLIAERSGGELRPVRVARLIEDAEGFTLDVQLVGGAGLAAGSHLLHGPFQSDLRPRGYDRNPRPLIESGGIALEPGGGDRELLKPGRKLILQNLEPDAPAAALVEIASYQSGASRIVLRTLPDNAAAFTKGWAVVRGNVLGAGHGESRGRIVLGSGMAEEMRQSFELPVENVSHVADPSAPAGVFPDLEISVGGRLWQQTSRFALDTEDTPTFVAAWTEAHTLRISFNRRLPTGPNNVVVERHRVGVGRAGNGLPPFGLTEPTRPHPLVAGVVQPFGAAGGADGELVSALRETAADHLRTLDRVVSVGDAAHLARRHSRVWQASARFDPTHRELTDRIRLTVVPAEGGPLGDLGEALARALAAKAAPNLRFVVERFEPVGLKLQMQLRIAAEALEPEAVREAVRARVLERFSLERRRLGQPFFIAEALAAAEATDGVATATVTIDPALRGAPLRRVHPRGDGALAALFPRPDQVLYLTSPADLTTSITETGA